MPPLVTISPAALEQLRTALLATGDPDLGLRAAARRGEDGAIEYGMGLDEAREQDERLELDDVVTVLVSAASRELIAGTVIDYVEIEPGQSRFVFYRPDPGALGAAPQAGGACACGAGGCGSSK